MYFRVFLYYGAFVKDPDYPPYGEDRIGTILNEYAVCGENHETKNFHNVPVKITIAGQTPRTENTYLLNLDIYYGVDQQGPFFNIRYISYGGTGDPAFEGIAIHRLAGVPTEYGDTTIHYIHIDSLTGQENNATFLLQWDPDVPFEDSSLESHSGPWPISELPSESYEKNKQYWAIAKISVTESTVSCLQIEKDNTPILSSHRAGIDNANPGKQYFPLSKIAVTGSTVSCVNVAQIAQNGTTFLRNDEVFYNGGD